MNGSVIVDSTVGKDTLFLITWTTNPPTVFIWDPSGVEQSGFVQDKTTKVAYLQIPGTAKVWGQLPCRRDKIVLLIIVEFLKKRVIIEKTVKILRSLKSPCQLR